MSPITQILVEKCISGWKEIEFETMRDAEGNAVSVCSMENIDPVGVHTGDSIVAAPALTLTDRELAMLRQAALDIVAAIGIIGGCNCQFALKPDGSEYAVIEVNPRVSRSSALASKATGYPIAKITTRLALGYLLSEIKNEKTGASLLGFEPAGDAPSNQQFFLFEPEVAAAFAEAAGCEIFEYLPDGRALTRFVCSWATKPTDVDELLAFAAAL